MTGLDDTSQPIVERRVVLAGALAGLALGATGCSTDGDAVTNGDAVAVPDDEVEPNETADSAVPVPEETQEPAPVIPLDGLMNVRALDGIHAEIASLDGFLYVPEAGAWIVSYPKEFIEQAKKVYPDSMHEGLDAGLLALHQKCPHLGCRVPECGSSQQFECPCHGSMYTHFGEHIGGPAPVGMSLIPTRIADGQVALDTGAIAGGLPRGTNITSWAASGPSCIGDTDHG